MSSDGESNDGGRPMGRRQAWTISHLEAGWRLAVREFVGPGVHGASTLQRACLLYATSFPAQPNRHRVRWRLVRRLIEMGAVETVATVAGCETYYRLRPGWTSDREEDRIDG